MRRGYARSCSPRKTGIVIGEWHSVLAMVPTAGHHGLLRLHSVLAVPQLATTDGLLRLHPSEGLRRPPKMTDIRRVGPCRRTVSTSTSCSSCCRWFCPSAPIGIFLHAFACPLFVICPSPSPPMPIACFLRALRMPLLVMPQDTEMLGPECTSREAAALFHRCTGNMPSLAHLHPSNMRDELSFDEVVIPPLTPPSPPPPTHRADAASATCSHHPSSLVSHRAVTPPLSHRCGCAHVLTPPLTPTHPPPPSSSS